MRKLKQDEWIPADTQWFDLIDWPKGYSRSARRYYEVHGLEIWGEALEPETPDRLATHHLPCDTPEAVSTRERRQQADNCSVLLERDGKILT